MTHGERWLAKAHKRLEGYCKTRGWLCGGLRLTSERCSQYEVFITDRLGQEACVVFEMYAGKPSFIDDKGILYDFDVRTFEDFVSPFDLAPKALSSKRQLAFLMELS